MSTNRGLSVQTLRALEEAKKKAASAQAEAVMVQKMPRTELLNYLVKTQFPTGNITITYHEDQTASVTCYKSQKAPKNAEIGGCR